MLHRLVRQPFEPPEPARADRSGETVERCVRALLERLPPDAGRPLQRGVSYPPMRCAHCASPLPDGSEFCTNCGADVREPASTPAASLDDAGVAKLTRMLREETAGEYEIEREIARGGMGVVYLATEIQLRRRVAIKVLPPTLTFGEAAIQRFRREARTAAALDHPNIIPIYRVSSGGELMWYSMKLLEGKSLDTLLKAQEHFAFEDAIAVLEQVADALDYAHQHGVIHRDIKPGNIVLDDRGRVTVTDFGIAKELQEGSLSASGALLGTPYYMAPEQYIGGEISGAADQYSLGVVAYQCFGRRGPPHRRRWTAPRWNARGRGARQFDRRRLPGPKRRWPSSSSALPTAGRGSTSTAISAVSVPCTARSCRPGRTTCGSSARASCRSTRPSRSRPGRTSSRSRCGGRHEAIRVADRARVRRRVRP